MAFIEQAPQGELVTPLGTEKLNVTDNTSDWWIQILNLIARKLRETGGPTTLSMGAIADGQFFKRQGTSIVGASQPAMPRGQIWGLILSNNSVDAVNDIDITTGEARDVDHTEDMVLASALTKRLDATWVVGNNQGMLDTGVVADNTYHLFLIKRTDTNVVDLLASLSATAPTMPTSYTKKRRVGSIYRKTGANVLFVQDGDNFQLKVPVGDVSVLNPGTAAVLRALSIPTGIRVQALLVTSGNPDTGNDSADSPRAIYISDPSVTDSIPSISILTNYHFSNLAANRSLHTAGPIRVFTNTSAQVRTRVQVSTADTRLSVSTLGWIDDRGRNY